MNTESFIERIINNRLSYMETYKKKLKKQQDFAKVATNEVSEI